jgi:hypothetical protein
VNEDLREPLSTHEAKALMRRILATSEVRFSDHALEQMAGDEFGPVSKVDVINVIRGGIVDDVSLRDRTWRYRVRTARICVVVAFRGASALAVVTVWRNKP